MRRRRREGRAESELERQAKVSVEGEGEGGEREEKRRTGVLQVDREAASLQIDPLLRQSKKSYSPSKKLVTASHQVYLKEGELSETEVTTTGGERGRGRRDDDAFEQQPPRDRCFGSPAASLLAGSRGDGKVAGGAE